MKPSPQPGLSVADGIVLVVGIVVGVGIFRTPGIVAANAGSEAVFIGLWVLGGVISMIGALCYAELATAYPDAGGEYHFLRRAYGRVVAFLFGWARATVVQPGAIATVAFVYGDYMQQAVPLGTFGPAIHAAIGVIVMTALNIAGRTPTKNAQHVFTWTLDLSLLAVVAVALLAGQGAAPEPSALAPTSGALGLALVFVLLTYGGWNEAAYFSSEVRNGKRNVVRVLVLGVAIVTALYVVVNAAFLHALGLEGLRSSDAVATDAVRLVAGESGAFLLTILIVFAALSTMNATVFTGARVYYALGRDIPQLRFLGIWLPGRESPRAGILLQAAITLALIGFGAFARNGFTAMVEYTAPVFWFFMLLVAASLVVLRRTDPGTPRPFRVPLYPLTPIVLCLTFLGLLYSSLNYTGTGALLGVAVLLVGLPFVLIAARSKDARP